MRMLRLSLLLLALFIPTVIFADEASTTSEFASITITVDTATAPVGEHWSIRGKGPTFTACGKKWMAGPDNDTSFKEAQAWIGSLGKEWETPTRDQLLELYNTNFILTRTPSHDDLSKEELKELSDSTAKLPFKNFPFISVWSICPKNAHLSWIVYFYNGDSCAETSDFQSNARALAVRSQ